MKIEFNKFKARIKMAWAVLSSNKAWAVMLPEEDDCLMLVKEVNGKITAQGVFDARYHLRADGWQSNVVSTLAQIRVFVSAPQAVRDEFVTSMIANAGNQGPRPGQRVN